MDQDERRVVLADRVVSALRKHDGWGRAERPLIQSVREGILASPLEIVDGAIDSIVDHLPLHMPNDNSPRVIHDHLSDIFIQVRELGQAVGTSDDVVNLLARGYGIQIAGRVAVAATFPPLASEQAQPIVELVTRQVELAYDILVAALEASNSGGSFKSVIEEWRKVAMSTMTEIVGTPMNPDLMALGLNGHDTDEATRRPYWERRFLGLSGQMDYHIDLIQSMPELSVPLEQESGFLWSQVEMVNQSIWWNINRKQGSHKAALVKKAVNHAYQKKGNALISEADRLRMETGLVNGGRSNRPHWRDSEFIKWKGFSNLEQLLRVGGIQWLDGMAVVPAEFPAEPGTPLDEDEPVIRP
ncbi:MAG: hypothetical protein GY895_13860 [Phycisphaera sp.]|nr:hypothetical protein [Phycisphaera sp.]